MEQEIKRDLPTLSQLTAEVKRIRYQRNFRKTLVSTFSSLLVVAAIAVLISMLFLPVLRVTGSSMTPTLQNDQMVICNKNANFESGDIIAFYYNNKILLKRVIATSGQWVNMDPDGTVYVNDEVLDEPYVSTKAFGECDIQLPYQVPDNRIFVMGDHRAASIDSRTRTVGCIAEEYIIGKVVFRIWPMDSFGAV
ncbi:MAG: signal peptidase I [Oscillospiraceae bacterium]|nr:signal peptidase I [Oscillospiraceae bacterium]MBR6617277.1 signal peptidase I [Oscillospiraceae bacterium]